MRIQGKQILVTGGAGFIGSHLVDGLSDCRVRVLDDFTAGRRSNLAAAAARDGLEILEGDVRDAEAVRRAMQGVDVVFHLACRGVRHSIGNPRENHEVNATGTLTVLQEAHRAGVMRFVHVSSSEVYGTALSVPMDEEHPCRPETVYGASKLAGEAYARAYQRTYGLPAVIVRPFNNFGPRSHHEGDSGEVIPRFAIWILNDVSPAIFGDGSQTRDFIYVADTAQWLRRAAECDELVGRTLNLGSGTETSILQLAQIVAEEAGRPGLKPRFLSPRPGDVQRHRAGIAQAQELLGFRPQIDLREGVGRLLAFLRNRSEATASLLRDLRECNWTMETLT